MNKFGKKTLPQQYAGVDNDPTQMGTTGLVAWVLHGLPANHAPRNRWERFKVAARVIRKRGLSVALFTDAIISTAHYYDINLRRFYRATRRMVKYREILRPEFYNWES